MRRFSAISLLGLCLAALGFRCPGAEPSVLMDATAGVGGAGAGAGGSASTGETTTTTSTVGVGGAGGAFPIPDCTAACVLACDDSIVDEQCVVRCEEDKLDCDQASGDLAAFLACYADVGCDIESGAECRRTHCSSDPADFCTGLCDEMIGNGCFFGDPVMDCLDNCGLITGNCSSNERATLRDTCVAPHLGPPCSTALIDDCVTTELGAPGQCLHQQTGCLPSEWGGLACG